MATALPTARSAQAGTTNTPVTTPPVRLTLNQLSDRRALNAYATYLSTLIDQQSVGQANDSSYITTISQPGTGGCKAMLEPLTQPPYQVDGKAQHTLTVLGEEIGDDLTLTFDTSAALPFAKFASVLRALHWGRLSGGALVVRRYINAQTNMLALPPSNLCRDAGDAELHPDLVPDGTKAFLPLYNDAATRSNLALTNLTTLMQTYEIPTEKALVARISTLAAQLAAQTKADLLQSGAALTSVLESN